MTIAFRTLQRRLTSPRDAANDEYGWFEVLGPIVRLLPLAEVLDLVDNHPGETWTATFTDGTTQTYLVKMEERGLRVPGCEWCAPTAMTALVYAMFYYHKEESGTLAATWYARSLTPTTKPKSTKNATP